MVAFRETVKYLCLFDSNPKTEKGALWKPLYAPRYNAAHEKPP